MTQVPFDALWKIWLKHVWETRLPRKEYVHINEQSWLSTLEDGKQFHAKYNPQSTVWQLISSVSLLLFEEFERDTSSELLFMQIWKTAHLRVPQQLRWSSLTKLPCAWVLGKEDHYSGSRGKSFAGSIHFEK